MHYFFLVVGCFLITLVAVDALWTTLWVDGGGSPVSSKLSNASWQLWLRFAGENKKHRLSKAGPLILVTTVLLWMVMLVIGWFLVFSFQENSLINSQTNSPVNIVGRLYFVMYTIFTLGNGEIYPNGGAWQILTSLANASGLILATLAITYLISVVSAVVTKRALASQIAGIGTNYEDFILNSWNKKDFKSLDLPLNQISFELARLCEQYLAYPVLQYYRPTDISKSTVASIFILDEALSVLSFGIKEELRPNPAIMQSARSTVDNFLKTMPCSFTQPADSEPPTPDLQRFKKLGIATEDNDEFADEIHKLQQRRKRLLGMLRSNGWSWEDLKPYTHC